MGSIYDSPDIYDLLEDANRHLAYKRHWEHLFKGKNIKSMLYISIGSGSVTLPVLDLNITLSGSDLSESKISDFEHQSTLFPPAPFVLIFLVRQLQKLLEEGKAEDIVERMIDQFGYYIGICRDAERMEHAHPLVRFSDLLDEENLLPERCTEEDLLAVFENPEAVPDALFYSFYYYSMIVLSQIPDILDRYGKFSKESRRLRDQMEFTTDSSE